MCIYIKVYVFCVCILFTYINTYIKYVSQSWKKNYVVCLIKHTLGMHKWYSISSGVSIVNMRVVAVPGGKGAHKAAGLPTYSSPDTSWSRYDRGESLRQTTVRWPAEQLQQADPAGRQQHGEAHRLAQAQTVPAHWRGEWRTVRTTALRETQSRLSQLIDGVSKAREGPLR